MRSAFSGASVVATFTARRAVSAAAPGSSSAWEAKPQVPSTMTRTARPISWSTTAVSSSPSRSCDRLRRDGVDAQVGVAGSGCTAADSAASASSWRGSARKSASTWRGAVTPHRNGPVGPR